MKKPRTGSRSRLKSDDCEPVDVDEYNYAASNGRGAAARKSSRTAKPRPPGPRHLCSVVLLSVLALMLYINTRADWPGVLPESVHLGASAVLEVAAIPRTSKTAAVESPMWEWGACSGVSAMYPASVCGRTYCLSSLNHPGSHIDVSRRAFTRVADASLLALCEEPAGGQAGPPRGAPVQVSFILTYKDNARATVQCMLELFRTAREADSVEFVLLDDGSEGDTSAVDAAAAALRAHFNVPVVQVRHAQPRGYGAANNAAVGAASGRYVALLNNDAFVTPGWLRALLETFRDEPRVGVVGPLFVNSTGWVMEAGGQLWADGSAGNFGRFERPQSYHAYRRGADYISAACIMMERGLFMALGGFKDEYGKGYWEDTDLAMEVHKAGLQVVYQPMAVVVHNEGGSLSASKEALMRHNHGLFMARWGAALAAHMCPAGTPARVAAERLTGAYRLLWIDDIVPEPDRDSGSIRAMNMVRILASLGVHVDYQPTTPRADRRYETEARFRGVHVLPVRDGRDIPFRDGEHCAYDVILVARFYIYERVQEFVRAACPHARVIFDTVDIHFLRDARVAMTGSTRWNFNATGAPSVRDWLRGNATEAQREIRAKSARELRLMRRSDVTLVVSPAERALLQRLAPAARVAVVSNVHDFSAAGRAPEGCAERRGLLFVGNFNHPPNQQAVLALLDDVLPEAARLLAGNGGGGNASDTGVLVLHIVGSNRGLDVDPLARAGGANVSVQFHGWLSDVELAVLYRSVKLVVAPLMSGAGVKGKINQAMLYGVPVVATPIAAEGMHLADGVNCLVASTPREFAAKLAAAYANCTLWERLVHGGFRNLERYFSVAAATRNIQQVLLQLGLEVPPARGTYACRARRRPPRPP